MSSFVVNTSRAALVLMVLAMSASASAQSGHVLRFNTNGTVDASLGSSNGLVLSVPGATSSVINETVVVSDKIYIVGSAVVGGVSCFMVGRRNANGTVDNTFSGDGFAFVNQTSTGEARSVAFFKGKLVAAGWRTLLTGETALVVARFNATDGSPDSGFGTAGVAQVTYPGFHAVPEGVAITPETQNVIVGGSRYNFVLTESDFMVTRFNANGTLYNAFGTNGTRVIEFTEANYVQAYDMDIRMGKTDAAGEIAVGGTAVLAGGAERCAVAVLNIAGTNNNNFDSDGRKVLDIPLGTHERCQALEYGVLSRIVIAGATWFDGDVDIRFLIGRLTTGGAWDTTFSGDGHRDLQFPELDGENIKDIFSPSTGFSDFAVVGSGFVTGGFDEVLTVAHFDWHGTPTSFGSGGTAIFDMPDASINVGNAVAIEPDGQVLTVGMTD